MTFFPGQVSTMIARVAARKVLREMMGAVAGVQQNALMLDARFPDISPEASKALFDRSKCLFDLEYEVAATTLDTFEMWFFKQPAWFTDAVKQAVHERVASLFGEEL
jgi:hypothetical protein